MKKNVRRAIEVGFIIFLFYSFGDYPLPLHWFVGVHF